jgi:hypothetical protein
MIVRVEERGIERGRPGEVPERRFRIAELPPHESKAIVRDGVAWFFLDGALVRLSGAFQIARAFGSQPRS